MGLLDQHGFEDYVPSQAMRLPPAERYPSFAVSRDDHGYWIWIDGAFRPLILTGRTTQTRNVVERAVGAATGLPSGGFKVTIEDRSEAHRGNRAKGGSRWFPGDVMLTPYSTRDGRVALMRGETGSGEAIWEPVVVWSSGKTISSLKPRQHYYSIQEARRAIDAIYGPSRVTNRTGKKPKKKPRKR